MPEPREAFSYLGVQRRKSLGYVRQLGLQPGFVAQKRRALALQFERPQHAAGNKQRAGYDVAAHGAYALKNWRLWASSAENVLLMTNLSMRDELATVWTNRDCISLRMRLVYTDTASA